MDELAVGRALEEAGITGFFDALGDPVQGPVQRTVFPVIRVRRAVAHRREPIWIDQILIGGGALRAQGTLVDRRLGVALDVDDAPVLDVDELATPDGAVRADGGDHLVRTARARGFFDGLARHRLRRHAQPAQHAQSKSTLTLDGHSSPPACREPLEIQYMKAVTTF